jgi:glycosyltransferase involved in cell wall biosynthesis
MMGNMALKISDALLEKLLLPGSRLRCAYETGLKGAGVIANEGFVKFFKKLNMYLDRNYMQPDLYSRWIEENEDNRSDHLSRLRQACNGFNYRPRFSIVFPVFNTEKSFLKSAIDSVLAQVYDNWELCAVDGNSTRPGVKEVLSDYSSQDDRIKIAFLPENEGIAGNSNRSLQMATGEYVAFLDHDDELSPLALYEFARMLNDDPGVDLIYSDEDKIDTAGKRFDPMFKPDWSPDMLRSCGYMGHLLAVRKDLAFGVGGFRRDFEQAQDYDFLLRTTEKAKKICHIDKVLYHWRAHGGSIASNVRSKRHVHENCKRALLEHCQRQGDDASILDGKEPFRYNVRYRHTLKPLVSVIIAGEGKGDSMRFCLESIIAKSTYQNYEIILAKINLAESDLADLSRFNDFQKSIKLLKFSGSRNWGAICNRAAKDSSGEILIFLVDDLEVVSDDWIESLIEQALRKQIGAVGGLIISKERVVQHAGLVLGLNGGADCICCGMSAEEVEANTTANLMVNYIRNVSAVARSCMCISRKKFMDAGGFDESLAANEGDVKLCRNLLNSGYLNIYTPFSVLACREEGKTAKHHNINRSSKIDASRQNDPYYSKNFDYNCRVPLPRGAR